MERQRRPAHKQLAPSSTPGVGESGLRAPSPLLKQRNKKQTKLLIIQRADRTWQQFMASNRSKSSFSIAFAAFKFIHFEMSHISGTFFVPPTARGRGIMRLSVRNNCRNMSQCVEGTERADLCIVAATAKISEPLHLSGHNRAWTQANKLGELL
jgi:hypothetical protein